MKTYEEFTLIDIHPPFVSGDIATHEFMRDLRLKEQTSFFYYQTNTEPRCKFEP
jgi:hypothetical protein